MKDNKKKVVSTGLAVVLAAAMARWAEEPTRICRAPQRM